MKGAWRASSGKGQFYLVCEMDSGRIDVETLPDGPPFKLPEWTKPRLQQERVRALEEDIRRGQLSARRRSGSSYTTSSEESLFFLDNYPQQADHGA